MASGKKSTVVGFQEDPNVHEYGLNFKTLLELRF